jgi:hypothetical protein
MQLQGVEQNGMNDCELEFHAVVRLSYFCFPKLGDDVVSFMETESDVNF